MGEAYLAGKHPAGLVPRSPHPPVLCAEGHLEGEGGFVLNGPQQCSPQTASMLVAGVAEAALAPVPQRRHMGRVWCLLNGWAGV